MPVISEIRKEAFRHFIKKGCMFLKQTREEDAFFDTFYCIKQKRIVETEECIDCLERRLTEYHKNVG